MLIKPAEVVMKNEIAALFQVVRDILLNVTSAAFIAMIAVNEEDIGNHVKLDVLRVRVNELNIPR